MLIGIGDLDRDRDALEEGLGAEIGADVEYELIGTGAQALAFEQRRVGAALGIGSRLGELGAIGPVELDADAGTGLAARRVQYMCGQSAHQPSPSSLARRPRAISPICASALRISVPSSLARRCSISASTVLRAACSRSAMMHGKPNFSRYRRLSAPMRANSSPESASRPRRACSLEECGVRAPSFASEPASSGCARMSASCFSGDAWSTTSIIAACSDSRPANGRAAYASLATHGECSKMPPSAASNCGLVSRFSSASVTAKIYYRAMVSAGRIMQRCDALARHSEQPDGLTRVFLSAENRAAKIGRA